MMQSAVDISTLQPFTYRILFVQFKRDKAKTFVNVTLDDWHLGWFTSEAETEEAFIKDCEAYAESEDYKQAYQKFTEGK